MCVLMFKITSEAEGSHAPAPEVQDRRMCKSTHDVGLNDPMARHIYLHRQRHVKLAYHVSSPALPKSS